MKIFCNCNSSWIADLDYLRSGINPQVQLNTVPVSYMEVDSLLWCNKCTYWRWYDAHYENMMFDLREMNQ